MVIKTTAYQKILTLGNDGAAGNNGGRHAQPHGRRNDEDGFQERLQVRPSRAPSLRTPRLVILARGSGSVAGDAFLDDYHSQCSSRIKSLACCNASDQKSSIALFLSRDSFFIIFVLYARRLFPCHFDIVLQATLRLCQTHLVNIHHVR
eukprot:SAG31_NODE_366_length_16817_cov_17.317921_19_plen_149_part_00